MIVHDGRWSAPEALRGAAAALGNLDGVHLGHQAVVAAAAATGRPLAAAVFEPHPRAHFRPGDAPFRLQSASQRAHALGRLGVGIVFELPFDAAMAAMTPEAFAGEILARRLGLAHVAVGLDFRFGKGRAGDAQTLRDLGAKLGFAVSIVDAVDDLAHGGEKVSSSMVRDAVRAGACEEAARLMGRPFAIEGVVIAGARRGRTIGFPTANIALAHYVRPRFGVYAVKARLHDGREAPGVANIGMKPTVGGTPEPLLEAHLFDFAEDLYGRAVEVALVRFIRDERKFDSFDALVTQIAADADTARALLAA